MNAGASVRLVPLWKGHTGAAPDLVARHQLADVLSDSNVLLALAVGAQANIAGEGSFKYGVLTAGATLEAGAEASYLFIRAFERGPAKEVLTDFMRSLSLPAACARPPRRGDVISLEYGGALRVGASLAAEYEVKGTQSLAIRDLKLAEHWKLGVVGKMEVSGSVAGRFQIDVRGLDADWVRVTVRRARAEEFRFGADVSVGAELKSEGLPKSGREFLGALLGVHAKSWLDLVDGAAGEVGKVDSLSALKERLDDLSGDFIERWTGKAVDRVTTEPEIKALLQRINTVVESYRTVEDRAVALFERFVDPVFDRTEELGKRLDDILALADWSQLKGEIDPSLWNAVRQLTDGDPLGWALGHVPGTKDLSLPELKKRAEKALALLRGKAHQEIRDFITTAKTHFGVERLMEEFAGLDTPEELRTRLTKEARHLRGGSSARPWISSTAAISSRRSSRSKR